MTNFAQIVKEEGILSLWKGSLFPLLGFGLCSSILFSVNESSKKYFKSSTGKLGLKDYFISGGLAGIANSIISSPMEHIRIRM
jgi:solute carrier family 25 carnitine/acylcarnitine transporter 20/29